MYKSCSKCGKIHSKNYKCDCNKIDWSKYNSNNEEYKLRNTYAWHKKSEEIKKDSRYLCSVCEDEGIYNYNQLETHHIIKIREDKTRLLDNYNLICLCLVHHKQADRDEIDKNYLFELAKKREERKV